MSINRDKQFHRQGYSDSDQIMARALMTPDELRRMDNDLCIIYEKGLKPIKDEKYYYFETPMAKKLSEVRLNHLEFDIGNRGKWRKFNPYNPYSDEQDEKPKDLKVESLDDLFEEDSKEDIKVEQQNSNLEKKVNIEETENFEAPVLPQEDEEVSRSNEDVMSVDVQKELEAKFDELFGAFDEEDDK